jgi:hypothetical protein
MDIDFPIEEMLLSLHELLLSSIGLSTSLIGFFEGTNHLIVIFLGHFRELDHLIVVTDCLISQGLCFIEKLPQIFVLLKLLFAASELSMQSGDLINQLLLFVWAQDLSLLPEL